MEQKEGIPVNEESPIERFANQENKESPIEKAAREFQQNEAAKPSTQPKKKGKKSKFAFKKKKLPVVSEDEALTQIELLFDRYRIDIEEMMEDDLEYAEAIESSANIVLKAIMFKEVEIYIDDKDNGKLKVKQHIQHRSKNGTVTHVVYSELEGVDNTSMPEGKKINSHDKMYALLGSMNEDVAGIETIKHLRSSDLKTAQALASLFLVP
jgi:hypothetical protein